MERLGTYFQPPPGLAKRVLSSVRRASHADRTLGVSPWRLLAVAASHILEWTSSGMTLCAVFDLSEGELQEFALLIQG